MVVRLRLERYPVLFRHMAGRETRLVEAGRPYAKELVVVCHLRCPPTRTEGYIGAQEAHGKLFRLFRTDPRTEITAASAYT